ncbi:Zn-ribbon domain-containing OB-fold protein [Nocardioides sp. Arc9.136]|uniref:Zn-ribbon domain-containing OB-fold protein n=1 Tax=Nocardioides sp. Arc9.136 TaxID=2996826 RepID=UPI00266534FC|nr:OB-fold domain-containing protein [Nocardioides sp. Arc9.136]WKN48464.1 OB-fold domain-containing protein [Nocardioides sp. Arc9.136]
MNVDVAASTRPSLVGSRCRPCGNVAFPVAAGCQRCGSAEMEPLELARQGTVWAHTVQRFAPKSPPYVPPAAGFAPFAVGYVELADGVRVEARLECGDPAELDGAEVTLVATEPVPTFATAPWLAAGEAAR